MESQFNPKKIPLYKVPKDYRIFLLLCSTEGDLEQMVFCYGSWLKRKQPHRSEGLKSSVGSKMRSTERETNFLKISFIHLWKSTELWKKFKIKVNCLNTATEKANNCIILVSKSYSIREEFPAIPLPATVGSLRRESEVL